jgi:hypothetical protein
LIDDSNDVKYNKTWQVMEPITNYDEGEKIV